MCGFLGWFGEPSHQLSPAIRAAGLNLLVHRGPDDEGSRGGDRWWLGFRRLAILDLSEGGAQPMGFVDGRRARVGEPPRYWLVFNGEIYNYRELAYSLREKPQSSGDTEVLGCLLARHGAKTTLPRLRGMFGFLWYDTETGIVQAVRGPFGIKPLYFHQASHGSIYFSSEVRALSRILPARPGINRDALASYLRFGAIYSDQSLLEGIQAVPQGSVLTWQNGKTSVEPYFSTKWRRPDEWPADPAAVAEHTREVVEESLLMHLRSDVPVGLFISGGLDSAIVAAGLRKLGQSGMKAFHIGYRDATVVEDERAPARQTADWMGASYEEELLDADEVFGRLPRFFGSLDQPSGDALNGYLASQLAARHVKVAISAIGPDEWFAGYRQYQILQVASALPFWKIPLLARISRAGWEKLPLGQRTTIAVRILAAAVGARGTTWPEIVTSLRRVFSEEELNPIFGSDIGWPHDDWFATDGLEKNAPHSWLNQTALLETYGYLEKMLLRDADSVSMSQSLELRVPFIDPEVFKLAALTSPQMKLRGTCGKWILRQSFANQLPEWVTNQRMKKTFTLPLMRWLREPRWKTWAHDILRDSLLHSQNLIPQDMIDHTLTVFYSLRSDSRKIYPITQRLWLLLVLENWLQAQNQMDRTAA